MTFNNSNNFPKKNKNNGTSNKKLDVSDLVVKKAEDSIKEIFGEDRVLDFRPLFLKNRTLTIACVKAELAAELMAHQVQILEKINEKLGKKDVDRIRYLL